MPPNLTLSKYSSNTAILSSLAWNAVRDVCDTIGKPELIRYVESVKVTEKRITIRTGKPIVNQELLHHQEVINERIEESFQKFGERGERKIVLV